MSVAILDTRSGSPPLSAVGDWSEGSFWFALQAKPRHEKKVNLDLAEEGIKVFFRFTEKKEFRKQSRHDSTDSK